MCFSWEDFDADADSDSLNMSKRWRERKWILELSIKWGRRRKFFGVCRCRSSRRRDLRPPTHSICTVRPFLFRSESISINFHEEFKGREKRKGKTRKSRGNANQMTLWTINNGRACLPACLVLSRESLFIPWLALIEDNLSNSNPFNGTVPKGQFHIRKGNWFFVQLLISSHSRADAKLNWNLFFLWKIIARNGNGRRNEWMNGPNLCRTRRSRRSDEMEMERKSEIPFFLH